MRIRNRHRVFRRVLFSGIVLILIWLAFLWLRAPSKGTFKTVVKESPAQTLGSGSQKFDGTLFTVTYPDGFSLKDEVASDSGTLEKIILLGTDVSSKKVTISSEQTKESDLSNISAVQYRRLNFKRYLEKPIELHGRNGLLYERLEDSYEKTALFLQDGIVTVIALTAPLIHTDFDKDYTALLDNFFWK